MLMYIALFMIIVLLFKDCQIEIGYSHNDLLFKYDPAVKFRRIFNKLIVTAILAWLLLLVYQLIFKETKVRKKVFLMLVLGLFLVSATFANGQQEARLSESGLPVVKIGWAPPTITGVYQTATNFMEMAVEDAKAHGIDIELITRVGSAHKNVTDQVSVIENLIQSEVDVIILSPSDVAAIIPALKQVNKAGIPLIVVNLLKPIDGVEVDTFIGFDNQVCAAVSGYAMLDALGGPGVLGSGEKVNISDKDYLDLAWWEDLYKDVDKKSISGKIALVGGVPGSFYDIERMNGFHSVVDNYPNIDIKSSLNADWQRQPAVAAGENILQANQELDAIWASCAEMGIGVSIAVKNMGRDDVLVLTNDGTPESVDLIRKGNILAETWHGFPEWGWYGVEFGTRLALNLEAPAVFDIRPRTEYKVNADMFYPEPYLSDIDWKSIIDEYKAGR